MATGSRRTSHGLTKQHGQAMEEVLAWARLHPQTTPLEAGILEEMCERVKQHAKDGAIVRVRAKNLGDRATGHRPAKTFDRNAHERRLRRERAPADRPFGVRGWRPEWAVAELDKLERLCREGATMEDIREAMPDRSHDAIKHQMSRLRLHARPVHSGGNGVRDGRDGRDGRGVLARARALRAARLEEMRATG